MVIAGLLSLYLLRADLVARVDDRLLDGATFVRDVIASRPGAVIDEGALEGQVNPDATALFYDERERCGSRHPARPRSRTWSRSALSPSPHWARHPCARSQDRLGSTWVMAPSVRPVSATGPSSCSCPRRSRGRGPAGDGAIDRVVIALPLEGEEATIRSLALIELLAGGLALLLLVVVMDRLLRRLLQPLTRWPRRQRPWPMVRRIGESASRIRRPRSSGSQLHSTLPSIVARRRRGAGVASWLTPRTSCALPSPRSVDGPRCRWQAGSSRKTRQRSWPRSTPRRAGCPS